MMTLQRLKFSSFSSKTVIQHILIWIAFIAYEIAYVRFTTVANASILRFVIYYVLNITLFYVNAHAILDYSFFKTTKPYLISTGLIILEIAVYLFVKFQIDLLMLDSKATLPERFTYSKQFVILNIWRGIYFIGFSIAYWSMLYMVRFKERNHHMEKEQLKSLATTLELENKYISVENAYLQNQISPHLLFNSLSFIHNEVYKISAEAGDSVARLSDLMRYSLVSADDSRTVLLRQEVAQLENLVELCQMRFREQFYLRLKKKGKLSNVRIIPLILVTLVENMMKHGDMGDKKQPALIKLELKGNQLLFGTRNKKRNTHLYPKNGLGLKNIEKRLKNYYQDRYLLLIREEEELFTINLTIHL
jgi:two-component system LytT family sensor kinase